MVTVGTGTAATTFRDPRPRAERRGHTASPYGSYYDDRGRGLSMMLYSRNVNRHAWDDGDGLLRLNRKMRTVRIAAALSALLALVAAAVRGLVVRAVCPLGEHEDDTVPPLVTQLVGTLATAPTGPPRPWWRPVAA